MFSGQIFHLSEGEIDLSLEKEDIYSVVPEQKIHINGFEI